MPGKRTGKGGKGTNDRRTLDKHLSLRGHHFIDIGDGSAGQQRTSEDVLTLDRAIEWTRANNRGTKRAKFDIDGQREASAIAKTAYYLRYDTYLLATEFERRAWGNAYDASSGRGHSAAQTHDLLSYSRFFCRYTRSRAG